MNWSSYFDVGILTLIFAKAFPLFMVLDPMGNVGILATVVAPFDMEQQKRILKREVLFALVAMFIFYLGGGVFLESIHVSQAAVEMTGGIIFFLVTLRLLFPEHASSKGAKPPREPFIVPIAIPLIAGPSCLATIILYSHESIKNYVAISAILLAWLATAIVVLAAPLLAKAMGKTGIKVVEQVVGLICALLAVKTFLKGLTTFLSGI